MNFKDALMQGKAGESIVARWLNLQGYSVLPAYEKLLGDGKGPRLFAPNRVKVVCPDLLAVSGTDVRWVEVKHKDAFSWSRRGGRWETGLDYHLWEQYCSLSRYTPFWRVWLLFLHEGRQAKDSPPDSPSGLFSGFVDELERAPTRHVSDRWAGGMIYWGITDLRRLAGLSELLALSGDLGMDDKNNCEKTS